MLNAISAVITSIPTGVGHDDAETLIAKGRTLTL
jgi:hypothetical protein